MNAMQNKITIYRGSHQIGGCATEISTGKHRVIIDFGANLPDSKAEGTVDDETLAKIVFNGEPCDGVLFTHYHGDHIGLYQKIPQDIPLYIGSTAKKLLEILTLGERRIETAIVKQHMKKDANAGWCVVDMEYTVSKKLNSAGKKFNPDIVVFDSTRGFGFIELKYDNKSADNLSKHYNDVQNIIRDEETVKKITEELIRRSGYLGKYSLIEGTLYETIKNSHNLWQGFLFVGGKRENTVNLVKNYAKFSENQNCRFAFYPYDEENSADCVDKIKLDYQSMQTYDDFIGTI